MTWPIKKLGEVIEISYGKGLPKDSRVDSGKYFAYGSNGPVYNTDKSLTNGETIVIGRKGTAGALYFISDPCWPIDTTFFAKPKNDVSLKFIYYLLRTKRLPSLAIVTGVPGINRTTLANINVQLPSLQIQKQIVERLDKIAEAQKLNDGLIQKTDELFQSLLHKELNPAGPAAAPAFVKTSAGKKAMAGKKDWEVKKLEEVLDYEQPIKYIVSSTDYKDEYLIPVLTAGKSFVLGNTNEKNGIFLKEELPVIIFDDFTTAIKFVDFPFKVKSSAIKILHAIKGKADINFLFYTMQIIKFFPAQHKRYWISEYSQIKVRIPSLETQKKIVAKLSAVQDYKKQLLEQQSKLKELFDSALAKSMTTK